MKKHDDAAQDKPMMVRVARSEVAKHEKQMHAKGGLVSRGGGKARKSALKFSKNG